MVPIWQRPNWTGPTGGRTRQHYIAFFAGECPELEVDAAADGLPDGDPLADFELEAYTDRGWIQGWWAGPLGAFLTVPEVRVASCAMGAWSGKLDGKTLAGLQGGMALCRAWARAGAIAVLDVVSLRWWTARELLALAPDRPFAIEEHVMVYLEDDRQGFCHTRGMAKVARPDLGGHGHGLAELIATLAETMALGANPADGEQLRVDGQLYHLAARPDDSNEASPLFFNRWLEVLEGPRALLGGPPQARTP